jgi:hypothetical protein
MATFNNVVCLVIHRSAAAPIFLGMANLCYFGIIDVSTLQRPVLLLGLSTLQRRVLHLDVSTLQRHVLHIAVSTLVQRPVLNLDVSTLQRSLLHLDVSTSWCHVLLLKVSTHRYLYFSWRCLQYRGLWVASRRVYTKEPVLLLDTSTPQRPDLHLDLSTLQVFTQQRP